MKIMKISLMHKFWSEPTHTYHKTERRVMQPDSILQSNSTGLGNLFFILYTLLIPFGKFVLVTQRNCEIYNMKSIFKDVVFRQGVSCTSSTILSFHTLCSVPKSLQPIYPSRHCAQTRRYLQVFNQSILPDIVLKQDVNYKSLTTLSFQ